MGRFEGRDPLGEAGSPNGNLFTYVGNSPVNYMDPFGLIVIISPYVWWPEAPRISEMRKENCLRPFVDSAMKLKAYLAKLCDLMAEICCEDPGCNETPPRKKQCCTKNKRCCTQEECIADAEKIANAFFVTARSICQQTQGFGPSLFNLSGRHMVCSECERETSRHFPSSKCFEYNQAFVLGLLSDHQWGEVTFLCGGGSIVATIDFWGGWGKGGWGEGKNAFGWEAEGQGAPESP